MASGPVSVGQFCTLSLSLRSRLDNWRLSKAPPQVIDYIKDGHKLPWISKPAKFHHGVSKCPEGLKVGWQELKARYLQNGAIKQVNCTGYTSRSFLIPKKGGGLRLIVDLRFINQHVRKYNCRYESLKNLQALAKKGYHMVSFDLQDAYQCVAIHEDDQSFLSFCVDGEYFACSALPFGYTNSPYVFTKVARHFTQLLRAADIPPTSEANVLDLQDVDPPFVLAYLDDFLVVAKSPEACRAAVAKVLAICEFLGLRLKLSKCQLEPTQVLEHLGMVIDFEQGTFTLSAVREAKVKKAAKDVLMAAARNKRVVQLKALQQFTGLAQSCKLAVPLADHFLRSLYNDMALPFRPGYAKLAHQSMSDLKFWVTLAPHNVGAPIWQPPAEMRIYTDASSYAFGAILADGTAVSIPWEGDELKLHINLQELLAVVKVLSVCEEVHGCVIQLCVDNMCVVHWLAGMSAKCPAAQSLLRHLVSLLQAKQCVLQPVWIPSSANPADAPSRSCQISSPIELSAKGKSSIFKWLKVSERGWVTLNQPTPQAAATAFVYQGPPVLVLLPTGSLPKVLSQLAVSNQPALVLSPWWEAQVWFPLAASASHWVVHLPQRYRVLFSNLPQVWGRSKLALWGINL
jgi:hypothetical protein